MSNLKGNKLKNDLKNSRLQDQVKRSIEKYFKELNGELPCNIYQLVLSEMEKPLLEVVMRYAEQNQSRASKILGINRNTLRKKLESHQLT